MKNLKDLLRSGGVCIGSWIMSRDPITTEVLACSGLDWLAIDMEHAPIAINDAADLIRVGTSCGMSMLVRLPDHNPTTIKQILDAGAAGVIAPEVRSVDQARALLNAMLYPASRSISSGASSGIRGSALARAHGYGRTFVDYMDKWNRDAVFIPMIEHIDAVREVGNIAAMDGVDAIFIGPYDLSASLGLPGQFDHPEVASAIDKIVNATMAVGKTAGFHSVPAEIEPALSRLRSGVRLLAFSSDLFILRHQIDEFVSAVHRLPVKRNLG